MEEVKKPADMRDRQQSAPAPAKSAECVKDSVDEKLVSPEAVNQKQANPSQKVDVLDVGVLAGSSSRTASAPVNVKTEPPASQVLLNGRLEQNAAPKNSALQRSDACKLPPQDGSMGNADAGSIRDFSDAVKLAPVGSNLRKLPPDGRTPMFDYPAADRMSDGNIPSTSQSGMWGGPIRLGYNVRELLLEEGLRVVDKKRAQKLQVIEAFASSTESKQINSELITRLRIEQRKLRLMDLQARIRDEVEEQQQEIMAMGERAYRKFVRLCERQRADLLRHVLAQQRAAKDRQLKSLLQWRKKLLESQWATRDARTTRNRGVAKYHERMLREFSKKKDEDRTRRMEALKNNDVDAYREMLLQQQTQMPGDAGERFEVLSSFLSQTEEYLHKLGGKISAVKNQQEMEEAKIVAAASARAQV